MGAREVASFATAGFGQNLLFNFVNLYLLVYLIEGVGLSTEGIATVTLILALAKIWDAINDLLMGLLVDHTRTRWGRFRPYILISAVPIAILTALMFAVPAESESRQLLFFGIVYVLWDVAYTLSDVPYWAMTTAITTDQRSRDHLISMARTAGMLALLVTTLGGVPLASAFSAADSPTAEGWTKTAVLLAVVGMSLFTLAFWGTREKVEVAPEPIAWKDSFRDLTTNGPLFLVLVSNTLSFGRAVLNVAGAVVALVVFGSEGLFPLIGGFMIAGILAGVLSSPAILRRFTRRDTMIAVNLVSAVIGVAAWFLGYGSLTAALPVFVLFGITLGMVSVVHTSMVGDTAEWAAIRTGRRSDGVAFASLTFIAKLTTALATALFGAILAAVGYEKGVEVTTPMRDAVWASVTIAPAISGVLAAIPLFFYHVPEDEIDAARATAD